MPCSQMERMESSLESVKRSFSSVRTGRASPSMLDRVEVGVLRHCEAQVPVLRVLRSCMGHDRPHPDLGLVLSCLTGA